VPIIATTLCVSGDVVTVMVIVSSGLALSGLISGFITGGVLSTEKVSGVWLALPTRSRAMSRME